MSRPYNESWFVAYALLGAVSAGLALLLPMAPRGTLALVLFAVTVVAWSLLSVAGTTLAAASALPEGTAMGLYSANGALAGVSGALLGGALVHFFGYGALPLAATGLLLVGVILSRSLPDPNPESSPEPHDATAGTSR